MINSRLLRLIGMLALALTANLAHAIGDVALVTAVKGTVVRVLRTAPVPLESFVKLKEGDALRLEQGASVRIVYFEGGRQETWEGGGQLTIGAMESKASGLPVPAIKVLPSIVVRQIAKTPALDSQGRAGVTRLRSIGSPDALSKLEAEYDRLRVEGDGKDLNAEIYLLAGLFELRELERVENLINDLKIHQKDNMEAMVLVSLYRKALNNVRKNR